MSNERPVPLTTGVGCLDRRDVATLLKISLRTLDRLDAAGHLPPPLRVGGRKRWLATVITEWISNGCPQQSPGQKNPKHH
jgi:predicted DNA-binding transcriptional regulator AlpA